MLILLSGGYGFSYLVRLNSFFLILALEQEPIVCYYTRTIILDESLSVSQHLPVLLMFAFYA